MSSSRRHLPQLTYGNNQSLLRSDFQPRTMWKIWRIREKKGKEQILIEIGREIETKKKEKREGNYKKEEGRIWSTIIFRSRGDSNSSQVDRNQCEKPNWIRFEFAEIEQTAEDVSTVR